MTRGKKYKKPLKREYFSKDKPSSRRGKHKYPDLAAEDGFTLEKGKINGVDQSIFYHRADRGKTEIAENVVYLTRKENKNRVPRAFRKNIIDIRHTREMMEIKPSKKGYSEKKVREMRKIIGKYSSKSAEHLLASSTFFNLILNTMSDEVKAYYPPQKNVSAVKKKADLPIAPRRVSLADMVRGNARFETLEDFSEHANLYLDWCEQQKKWPSVAGLANFLGFDMKSAPIRWKNDKPELYMAYELFKQQLAEIYEQEVISKKANVVGVIFLMKNALGYQDRIDQKVEHSGQVSFNVVSYLPPEPEPAPTVEQADIIDVE